ncbi:hypothetical protein DBV05_g4797 [Lasiodiplodia theobromae]|uniref:Uncharacterized protein n=1 Tax=Lasiodiplodia theobromae TaxID=45133 RepID=A0A5N5DF73_9PEZI|nr:hypothetical protein DBV05_g4797 [Lasiodiplodia theobromae]
MAKPIARSKSMTLKRSKRTSYLAQPLPGSDPHVLNAAAMSHNDLRTVERMPPKRADSGTASASGDEIPRPRTANSAIDRSRPLRTTGAPIQIQHDEQTFDFPTPSPEAVNHSRERLQRDLTAPIGMALGSPNQTNANAWKQSHPAEFQDASADTNSANVDAANDADVPPAANPTAGDGKKPKISRWKSLFGRRPADKPPATPAPFYQLQMPAPQNPAVPVTPARKGSHGDAIASQASLADNEKSKGAKGEEKKARTRLRSKSSAAAEARLPPLDPPKMPTMDLDQGSPKKEPLKKKPSRFFGHKEPRPQVTRADTSPMLNVDIPTIEMERYSVMFGSLLKGDRQSNLLLRRQGNDRLKPLNSDCLRMADQGLTDEQGEDELPKPIRRATSPATPTFQTPTLNLSLFPRDSMSGSRSNSPAPVHAQSPARTQSPAPKNLNLPKPQHRLQRSFTAPASPGRPTFNFDVNDSQAEKQKPVVATNITEEPENTEEICIGVRQNDLISHAFSDSTRDSQASLESAESGDAAIRLKESKYNNKVDVSGWEMVSKKQPDLQVQTAVSQDAGSALSLQSQSPLSSLSGQSVAQAKESVARQNSLREKQRRERGFTHTQSPTTQPETPVAAPSPRNDQRGRKPSYTSSPGSDNHQGEQARDKDAEMMLEQQRQFRERKQKQKEEQAQQPQQNFSGPRRQPTLKERAEEVQNANRVAIARQVSISRQRAQQEMLRAQKSGAGGHNATNGIGSTTISSNQKNTKFTPSDHNSQNSSPKPTAPSIVIPEDEPKPKLARQESLRRAGRNAGPTTMVVQSPTGERLVEKRTLTPVLVDIPNRKSVVGNIVDESDFDVPLMPPPKPFALSDPNRASTVSFSHLNC